MMKTRIIKVKSIENEEIIMAMVMTKITITILIMKIIIITMILMRRESEFAIVWIYKNVKIE